MARKKILSELKSKYLRPGQLESEYGISRWTMYVKNPPIGFPQVFRVGKCVLVSREEVEKFIAAQIAKAESTSSPSPRKREVARAR